MPVAVSRGRFLYPLGSLKAAFLCTDGWGRVAVSRGRVLCPFDSLRAVALHNPGSNNKSTHLAGIFVSQNRLEIGMITFLIKKLVGRPLFAPQITT